MIVDAREVCAHPVVVSLSETTRAVYLTLLRESDQWGELTREAASRIARAVLARASSDASASAARRAFEELHAVALIDSAGDGVCVWTPRQREGAAAFAAHLDWIEGVSL